MKKTLLWIVLGSFVFPQTLKYDMLLPSDLVCAVLSAVKSMQNEGFIIEEKKMAVMIATTTAARVPMEKAILPIRVRVRLAITGTWVTVSSRPVIIFTMKPKSKNFSVFILNINCLHNLCSSRGDHLACLGELGKYLGYSGNNCCNSQSLLPNLRLGIHIDRFLLGGKSELIFVGLDCHLSLCPSHILIRR